MPFTYPIGIELTDGTFTCPFDAGCIQTPYKANSSKQRIESSEWVPRWFDSISLPDSVVYKQFNTGSNHHRLFTIRDCPSINPPSGGIGIDNIESPPPVFTVG